MTQTSRDENLHINAMLISEIEALQGQVNELKLSQDKVIQLKAAHKRKVNKLKGAVKFLENERNELRAQKQAF